MLRKLFISLIILSTLATEGIINFPGNVYNFLSRSNLESCLNKNTFSEPENGAEAKVTSFSSIFKLTAASLQKIKISEYNFYNKLDLTKDSKKAFYNEYILTDSKLSSIKNKISEKHIILNQSDVSPPRI